MKRGAGRRKMFNDNFKDFKEYKKWMLKAVEFVKLEDKELLEELSKR